MRRQMRTMGLVLAAAAFLAGCGSTLDLPAGTTLAAGGTGLPPVETRYVIGPGDVLAVKFYYHPEADVPEATVRTDGKLTLPMIGTVHAAGLTPTELAKAITPLYAKNLRDPKIDVSLKTLSDSRVYVGGEVHRPGFVQYRPGMTALEAVVDAGGFKDTARPEETVLVQAQADQKYRTAKLNLGQALEAGNTSENLPVGPSDVIFVPMSAIAIADQWVDQYIVKMLPVRLGIGVRAP